MLGRVVLISDDKDFFEYIIPKLLLRKSDELFRFSFGDLTEKFHQLDSALLIINSENNQEQTLELLSITQNSPAIIFGYNDDTDFKIKGYRAGMFAYIPLSASDEEIQATILPALKLVSSRNKNNLYREILVRNNLITPNNEVFLDPNTLIERELEKIHKQSANAVLGAISPDEKSKFSIQANQIETIILNNIRENDLLINFTSNKYYLLLYDTDTDKAYKLWEKISSYFSEPLYAGFTSIGRKNRQQIVNEALNKLHEAIHRGFKSTLTADVFMGNNFKFYKEEFRKKLDQIITPVFYHVQQIYNDKLFNMKIEIEHDEDCSILYIKSENSIGSFKITSPGYSTVNIEIEYKNTQNIDSKRITLEPDELEAGLLQDLLEQFIIEFKTENEEAYDKIE